MCLYRLADPSTFRFPHPGPIVFSPFPIPPPSLSSLTKLTSLKRVPSAPYGASKAGIRNMVHTLAMEWTQYSIRVNSVSPGLVKTAMTYWVEKQPDWEQQLKYYGGIPRLAEVEELGGAYVYLLSDAASYTTSIDIPVNGVIGIC
jgi:NAD(P)-dependent dehydrogenase (short-subunit alcohol dehydrogenase family)